MKYFIAASVVSLMAASAYAGGMPEELIEPTKITIEAMDASPTVVETTTSNPFDQLIRFAFMELMIIL